MSERSRINNYNREGLTTLNNKGVKAFKEGKYNEAIAIWHKALEIADDASIIFNKARAYENLGCLYLAHKGYDEVLKKEPYHTKAEEFLKTYEKLLDNFKLELIRNSVEQFITLEGQSSNDEIKISILKEIEQIEYGTLVKQFAYKKSVKEVKNLIIILNDLGYLTTKLGELSGDLKYYTDASIFYQYVIAMLDEKDGALGKFLSTKEKNKFSEQKLSDSYQQLASIQQLIFSAISTNQPQTIPNVQNESTSNKAILAKIRASTEEGLKKAEDDRQQAINNQEEKQQYQESYVKEVRKLFESIADDMQKFLAILYSDSEKEIGITPPCKYAVIGLGSMTLKQMTPYSDLEFAILTENDDYKKNNDPKVRKYFKNLSHFVNFKMINLGESIIPTSKYGVDMSHLVHRAVNFDLGGKTPLGRIDSDKEYKLVQTIDGMLAYVHNEKDWASHIDKNLPYILEKVCYVHGDKQLVETYRVKVSGFLDSKFNPKEHASSKNFEIRALKLLKEGAIESDYLQQALSLKPKEIKFKGDLEKLQPNLYDAEGMLFNVKQEIYRLPDRLIYNFGLYYGIEGDSVWDTVDKLTNQDIISMEAARNMKNAATFATTLRLKTYLHYKAQTEDMSIFSRSIESEAELEEQTKQTFHLSEEDLGEQGGMFQYFYTALPLHEKLKDFCNEYMNLDNDDRKAFFKDTEFYVDNDANKGLIYFRLAQYHQAHIKLEEAVKNETNHHKKLQLQNVLATIYVLFGKIDAAIKFYDDCLGDYQIIYKKQPHPEVAALLNNLGAAYRSKGQHGQAVQYQEKSLKMQKLLHKDEPHPDIATSLNNIGIIYLRQGQYDQAIQYHEESFKMRKLIYKDEPHPDVAMSLSSLGTSFHAKGQYDRAIQYYEDGLKMRKLIFKDQPHPDVAISLHNIGESYNAKGQYNRAIQYFEDSLKIGKFIYKDQPNPTVAGFLNDLGTAYSKKGQYDQAIQYYEDCLKMTKLIFEDHPDPDVANLLNNLGATYNAKGQYNQAIQYFKDSLKLGNSIYKDQPNPIIAGYLNNLGAAYSKKGQYDQAIQHYEDSLKLIKLIYKDQPHPNVAGYLINLGGAYGDKGQYDQAIQHFEDGLKIQRLIYKNEPHPDVAASLDNLGKVYSAKGQYDRAIQYYEDSLKMSKLIFKDQHHPDVASYLNKLGEAYNATGQYDQAVQYFEDSLKIGKLIFKDKPHPYVAASLNNLGTAYDNKGQYDRAIQCYDDSLNMRKLIFKDQPHPDVATSLNNLGAAYYVKKRYDQAIQYYEDSLKMRKLIFKDRPHPDVATSLNNLGTAYHVKKRYDLAIQYYEDSLRIRKLIFKDQPHPDVASSLNNLGAAYYVKKRYDQAIQYFEDSLKIRKLIFKDQPHPDIATSLINLGSAYAAQGEYKLALDYGNQACKVISVFPNHPYKNTIQDFMSKVKSDLSITTLRTNDNIDTDLKMETL
ncbi:uncharacterized protein LOC136091201 [Hydra vulgaris]|uniref:Uncharacterized protein LOC136091201 n=1 Tax=Hydra vulgaris TaxID=6087 RepID=A0ABM4DIH8_HYDVU